MDTSNGGTNDLVLLGQQIIDGLKIIKFKRKLVTGDINDKDFVAGKMGLLWAKGNSDLLNYHASKGEILLDFSPITQNDITLLLNEITP